MIVKNIFKGISFALLTTFVPYGAASEPHLEIDKQIAQARETSAKTDKKLTDLLKTQLAVKKGEVAAIEKELKKDIAAVPKKDEKKDNKEEQKPAIPAGIADDDNFVGDTFLLDVNAGPFEGLAGDGNYCAPANSKVMVSADDLKSGDLLVHFKGLNASSDSACDVLDESYVQVKRKQQYRISKEKFSSFASHRRGFMYGGLVVPFKYYMGGDKRISTSTTIAPYVGVRGTWVSRLASEKLGFHVTPIFSAGLGLVPVNKSVTDEAGKVTESTDTESALSTAIGLMITSEKNRAFSAGILMGRDFLSNEDRKADPTVDKWWTSLYVGINVK